MFRGTGEPGQITVLPGTCQKKLSYGFNPPECEQIPVMILLVIRHKICYHTRVKSEGESGVSRHSPDPRNQRGPAWSATQSPGLRPTARSRLGTSREDSVHRMACYFPSLVSLVWVKQKGARV